MPKKDDDNKQVNSNGVNINLNINLDLSNQINERQNVISHGVKCIKNQELPEIVDVDSEEFQKLNFDELLKQNRFINLNNNP